MENLEPIGLWILSWGELILFVTMSTFADIFDATATFLRAKGISPQVSKGRRASQSAVERFREQSGLALPESFAAFYTDFADGFDFSWQKTERERGAFSIPTLKQLSKDRRAWETLVRHFLDDPRSLDRCIDPPFRAEAFEIWRKMTSWVPFWDEGNGDHFCVDTSNGRIVYDQHDWFDGFGSLLAKTNGLIAGQSLADFLQNWSRFCFQPNKRLWWGEFGEFGAIKWEPEFFEPEFFRRG
jgi:cell wall assembly regulator SMI1